MRAFIKKESDTIKDKLSLIFTNADEEENDNLPGQQDMSDYPE